MTRTHLPSSPLALFLLAAAVVATLAFGLTRWFVDDVPATLPALEVAADAAAAAPGALDPAKLYAARLDTTVTIEATIDGSPMNGAGVVVDTDGTIITASHVVKDYETGTSASMIVVRFPKGDEVLARVGAIDQFNDIAILRIDPSQVAGLVAAPLADSDKVLVGAPVAAIGAPFGYEESLTLGNVSFTHRVLASRINDSWEIPDGLQFDAAINTGNSGGAVFNARGEVIGISQQIATPSKTSAGVAFAVSSNLVRRALRIHRETGATTIPYADLGISAVDLTPQLAAAGQLAASRGALVQSAVGPAATAGIGVGTTIEHYGKAVRVGAVILELAGRPIRSSDDLKRVAAAIDADEPVDVVYEQAGRRVEATIDPVPRTVA